MNREEELEFLKIDLNNIIQGMTICESLLSDEEKDHLNLHRRCLSILERIKVVDERKDNTNDCTRKDERSIRDSI